MITYCIVDDEPIAHRIIEGYCAELAHMQKVGNAYNALEATAMVTEKKVDLIFLDINMPKMTGFDWLKTLPHAPQVIVTSAYKEFALEGYELDVVDYLLKPFSFPRFLKAVNKVIEGDKVNRIPKPSAAKAENHRFFIKGDKRHHQIRREDILFVEAYGNYSKIYLADEMIISHEKITNLEELLVEGNFMRVHKSFLVATDKIRQIQGNQIMLPGHTIPIGQTYRSRVNDLLGNR
ncbi:MAG TPA: DNA-binding response regulator [Cytophagales bacterium]|nr:DNA-binding response regulator [Cytophagales bacterium]HAA23189.1 DNA-binding response regulator [Cytophagales bacterium]HAP59309.1 DNA-binding response regulator [Cytophagales bacterium]